MKCKTLSMLLGCSLFMLLGGQAVAENSCLGADGKTSVNAIGCVTPPGRPDIKPPKMPDRPEYRPPVLCPHGAVLVGGKEICKPIAPLPKPCGSNAQEKGNEMGCMPPMPKPPKPPMPCDEGHSIDGKHDCKPPMPKPPLPCIEGRSIDGKHDCKPPKPPKPPVCSKKDLDMGIARNCIPPKPPKPIPCGKNEKGKVSDCMPPHLPKFPPREFVPCDHTNVKGDCAPPTPPKNPVDPCGDRPCILPEPVGEKQSNLPD